MLLNQLDKTGVTHHTGSLLIFWTDDGKHDVEPWRSDGTVSGSYLLGNLNTAPAKKTSVGSRSYLEGGIVTIGTSTYFGCFEYFEMKPNGPVWDFGLYRTDGTSSGTIEIYDDLDVQKLIELNGNLIIDALDVLNSGGCGRELFIHDGSGTVPIGTMSAGQWGGEDDNPYTQWYGRHIYAMHEPVAAGGCAFFNTRSQYEGNELWCTDGNALRQVTGIGNGAHSTYPVFMTPMDGVLYFVGLDTNNDSELWSFPLGDPINSGVASVAANINATGSSEPAWLTVYQGDLYFSAYTETTGRELFRYDGSTVQLVADIAAGSVSSHPNYDPTDYRPVLRELNDIGTPGRFSMMEYDGKLYFAANDGVNGNELWSYDAATNTAVMVWDINAGGGDSDPHFLTVYNNRLYFTAYTPQYGRAWYEYDPGGSSVNQQPVAVASASPISGTAPLTVSFDGSGSWDPDGSIATYAWDFGDGSGTSTQMNPSYTYTTAGTYTAQLTVTDNDNATATADISITVTTASTGYVYVAAQTVTRVSLPGNRIAAEDAVLVLDESSQPVSGAVVSATYSGPTAGSTSATTDANGEAVLVSDWDRNPSGTWCFTVTDVQATGLTYNAAANVVTSLCEGTPKKNLRQPVSCILHHNYPNPFNPVTTIPFTLDRPMTVSLIVTDALGREVGRIVDEIPLSDGTHLMEFNANDLPSGMYSYRLQADGMVLSRRMVVLK